MHHILNSFIIILHICFTGKQTIILFIYHNHKIYYVCCTISINVPNLQIRNSHLSSLNSNQTNYYSLCLHGIYNYMGPPGTKFSFIIKFWQKVVSWQSSLNFFYFVDFGPPHYSTWIKAYNQKEIFAPTLLNNIRENQIYCFHYFRLENNDNSMFKN